MKFEEGDDQFGIRFLECDILIEPQQRRTISLRRVGDRLKPGCAKQSAERATETFVVVIDCDINDA